MAISRDSFTQLTRQLIGLPVTMPWRGYGSAVFLELGRLSAVSVKGKRQKFGQACILIEWSWRVERRRSIEFGSWSGQRKMSTGIARLKGMRVREIALVGRLPEILVELSGGVWLHSFMTAEGKPEWSLKLLDGSWLLYDAGRIIRQQPESNHPAAGKVGSASRLATSHHCSGLPKPARSVPSPCD